MSRRPAILKFLPWLRGGKQGFLLIGLVYGIASAAVGQSADSTDSTVTNSAAESARTLTFENRRICVFRAELDGYSPEERAAAAGARIESVLATAKSTVVTTEALTNGIRISLDGKGLFVVTPADVFSIQGQTLESKAAAVAAALRVAVYDRQSLTTPTEVAQAIGQAVLGFAVFVVLFWLSRRAKRWVLEHSAKLAAEKTKALKLGGLRTEGLRSFVAVLRTVLSFGLYLFVALLVFTLVWYELRCFPYSRPWGDYLWTQVISALKSLGESVLFAVPDLLVVAFITLAARMASQVLSRLFVAAERGAGETGRMDPVIAATTRRLLIWMVWIIAVLVAYPYIPGSRSLAFKGITVFVGIVVSLGSSNLVNQIASGLLLIYSRAYRAGDYVRIGETEGTVVEIGTCVTRVRTIKNEEVDIANSLLLGTVSTNYSRLAKSDGVFLSTKVTIGYSTPWRQVQAMLLQATQQTPGLLMEPPPFVLQTALSDFYVEYQLNVRLDRPERRVWVLSDLHARILDIFNEHGVQIMSPHYMANTADPLVVAKSNWFLAPAKDGGGQASPDVSTKNAAT